MRNKRLIIMFILLLVLVTGCEGKKEKRNASNVEVIKSVEPYDQQLNCSKDIFRNDLFPSSFTPFKFLFSFKN